MSLHKVKIQFLNQEYQQRCIANIIDILSGFNFNSHDNLDECLDKFYAKNPSLNLGKSGKRNLDILMETGTGKTFTYLNAIFEINKIYAQNKFIIFVPRKAILEGLKQNIKLTADYFYSIYSKHIKLFEYSDKKSLSGIINGFMSANFMGGGG